MTQLLRVVRDNNGKYHQPPEQVTVMTVVKQADFNDRPLIKVAFQDGAIGAVFFDEVSGVKQ